MADVKKQMEPAAVSDRKLLQRTRQLVWKL